MLVPLVRKVLTLGLMSASLCAAAQNRFWIATTASNWNNSANWSTVSGGAGGATVPGPGNVAIFNGAAGSNGNCTLDLAPTVSGITISGFTGTINLNGNTLTLSGGANTLTSGTVSNTGAAASLTLSAAGTTTFSGTLINVPVTGSATRLLFNGSTFGSTVTVTKTNATNDNGTGGNTFNAALSLTNNTTAQLLLGSTNPDIFNGPLSITSGNTGSTAIAAGGATNHQLNDNVSINYSSTGAVTFGTNNGPSVLAAGKTITVASFGAGGCGNLALSQFTASATAQSITLSGNTTATLTIGASSQFNGNLTATAPSIILNSSTFVGTTSLTKTGTSDDNIHGGNLFSGPLTVTNTSDNDMYFGHFPAEAGDTFNGVSVWNDLGGGRIRVAEYSAGTVFNAAATFNGSGANNAANRIQVSRFAGADVTFNAASTFNNNGNSSDMYIAYDPGTSATFNGPVNFNSATTTASGTYYVGYDGNVVINNNAVVTSTCGDNVQFATNNGTVTLNPGFTITVGGAGFALGQLSLGNFTQLGATPQSLTLTGTAVLQIGAAAFGGNVNFVSPRVQLNGATFNGTAYIEKNGANGDNYAGGNIFNSTATIVDSGSGSITLANANADTFNGDVTFTNTGSNTIFVATNAAGNAFNGNITVNATSGTGIFFSNNAAGNSTQAAGKSISVGGMGFSSGELRIRRFTQLGAAATTLTLTGTCILRVGPTTTFGGNVTFNSPQVYLDGATYNATAVITKTGATDNSGNGGNVFNGVTSLTDTGSGFLMTGNSSPDTFNDDLTITNSGSNIIYIAHNVPGTMFNGNVAVNSISGGGIYFSNSATGSSTMAATKTISVGGSGFAVGDLRLRRFTQNGNAPVNLTLTGVAVLRSGPSSAFGGNVTFVSPEVYLDGATYNGTADITKNGPTNNAGNGGNTFNGTTSLTDTGSGYLLTGNTQPDVFNGDLIVTNAGSNVIYLAYNTANNQFNGNIIFNETSGTGIYLCTTASGTATLADTKTVSIGSSNFLVGELRLARFTQIGSAAQTLLLGGNASLRVGPSSTFNGSATFTSPQLYLEGCTYNGQATLEKTGATGNTGIGNNVFATVASITNSGSGVLRTNGNNVFNGTTTITSSGSADVLLELLSGSSYNGDVTFTNTGTSNVRVGYLGTTTFGGNITVNGTAGTGVYFCESGTAAATLANAKSLLTGGLGFSTGSLIIQRFTQIGNSPQSLTLTGNAVLQVGPSTTLNGNVDFKAPQVLLNGCTYNGTTSIEKTGATNNDSNGNNIFNGVTTLTNSGSGWLRTARTALDQFNNDLTLTNTGTSAIYMSDLIAGSAYGGNIVVNSTLGTGIYFGNNGGTSTLAAGKALSVGASGFSFGELRLARFTQTGATPQTIALTGTADIRIGPTSSFDGTVDFRAPQVYLDGATYNGTAYIEKNGAGNNTGQGNNTFGSTTTLVNSNSGQFRSNGNSTYNGPTTLINSGTADMLMELTAGSTYNGDVTMTNTGSSYIRAAYIGTNLFNGNIVVNSLNATGVYFCENAAGTATLAATKTITIGATGFTAGELRLQRFTQTGATAQSLTLTGSAIFRTGPTTTWNGNLTVSSPQLFLDGTTFNGGTNSITKTGTSTDASVGGNTYNGAVTLTNSGTGIFRLSNTTGDTYNASATFVQSNGTIQPGYSGASVSTADITATSSAAIVFGANNGTWTMSGGSPQSINKGGSASPTIARLIMSKSGSSVTLNTDINISVTTTFTSGVINTSGASVINFAAGSTATAASNASYVDGPVRKTGNTAFTFPTGDNGIYRSIAISAPANVAHAFTAQYFKAAQALGGPPTYAATLQTVSSCEYWTLDRTTGASNVTVTLSWNSPDCSGPYITDITKLRVSRWNGTNWLDNGSGGTTGNATTGTVVSGAAITTFLANNPFTLASTSGVNPLPIELTSFTALAVGDQRVQLNWETASELNNDFFTIQRSVDGGEFTPLLDVKGAGTKPTASQYEAYDDDPPGRKVYYRLKQTDFDRKTTYSGVVLVLLDEVRQLVLHPNPVAAGGTVSSNYHGNYVVYNSLGTPVMRLEGVHNIPVASLSPGMYVVKTDNGLVQRLIID